MRVGAFELGKHLVARIAEWTDIDMFEDSGSCFVPAFEGLRLQVGGSAGFGVEGLGF